jgi:RimJ/RimL family protein N-acetyltransferase
VKSKTAPFLKSHTIFLRPIEEEDVTNSDWHTWYNDYQTTRYNSHGVFPINIDDQLGFFRRSREDRTNISLAICSKESTEIVGNVSLQHIDLINRKAEVACTVGLKASPTTGLESIGLITEHAFDRLNLNKVSGGAHEDLDSWIDMLASLGYKKEAIIGNEFFRNNRFSSLIRFSLLAEDFNLLRVRRDGQYLCDSAQELFKNARLQLKKRRRNNND